MGPEDVTPGLLRDDREASAPMRENRDRQAIIDTFMRQNHIAAGDAGRVKASFAKAYRERAHGGQWIQTDRGEWTKK